MKIFDAHCHLHDERLVPGIDSVMKRAFDAGVKGFCDCGAGREGWGKVLEFTAQHKEAVPAFGIHPWYVNEAGEGRIAGLADYLARTPSLVGEIGLDRAEPSVSMEMQEAAFRSQLSLAADLDLPVNIHCRKAWEGLIRILKKNWKKGRPFIIHSFSGTAELVGPLMDLGCYFSFGTSLTRAHNTRAHKVIQEVPFERLLVETDAPDIPPEIDGRIRFETPNEPANILYVIRKAAMLRNTTEEMIGRITWENACRVLDPILSKRGFEAAYDG
jgi:TatD DNase family protein